jgi:hypothetical protein
MLYWVGVYALVSFVVLLPLLLIYLVGCAFLLGLRMVGFTIRNTDTALAARTDFSKDNRITVGPTTFRRGGTTTSQLAHKRRPHFVQGASQ